MMQSKMISVIVPVYNEQDSIEWHHKKIVKVLSHQNYKYEIIYVDDGSTDESLSIIKTLAKKQTKYISFSRNFGKEAATTAGLQNCSGDAALLIDADGQHPIELLPEFIRKWEEGFQVIIGVRRSNKREGFVKKYGSKLFYGILNVFTEGNTVSGSTDFRLVDRQVIDEFNQLTERNRITRGLIDWLGFRRTNLYFDASARRDGDAAYSFKKLMRLALHALVSQTTKPLQITGILGGLVTVLSALAAVFLLVETYILNDPLKLSITGTAILALFISFLIGVVLMCQWLLALYIESIHSEAQNRPLFIIREKK